MHGNANIIVVMSDKQQPKNAFVREQIKDKPKNYKRMWVRLGESAACGGVFALAVCLVLLFMIPVLRQEEGPVPDTGAQDSQQASVEETEQGSEEKEETQTPEERQPMTLDDYQQIQTELYAIGNTANKSIVTITGVVSDTDWFNNSYEREGQGCGTIIGESGGKLWILTEKKTIKDAAKIKVTFVNDAVAEAKLFIDIGAKDKEDAEKYVKLGDYVTFDTEFMQIGSNVKGKALDRSGICTSLINAVEKEYKYDTYMCFLVQREVGARGAKIVSHRINADVILSVSSAETADMYGCESNAGVKLGDGAVVNFADKTIIADKEITEKMIKAAKKAKIKVQPQVLMPQTSDGGAMQSGANGAICLSASVPCRYSHSPVSVMSLDDINSMTEYIRLFLNKIGEMI